MRLKREKPFVRFRLRQNQNQRNVRRKKQHIHTHTNTAKSYDAIAACVRTSNITTNIIAGTHICTAIDLPVHPFSLSLSPLTFLSNVFGCIHCESHASHGYTRVCKIQRYTYSNTVVVELHIRMWLSCVCIFICLFNWWFCSVMWFFVWLTWTDCELRYTTYVSEQIDLNTLYDAYISLSDADAIVVFVYGILLSLSFGFVFVQFTIAVEFSIRLIQDKSYSLNFIWFWKYKQRRFIFVGHYSNCK